MLDKSIPYAGFFMHRPAGAPISSFPLPDGFQFVFYSAGDEMEWARIEASVLEFEGEFAALMHFNEKFMPFIDELERRCLFIKNDAGDKIATIMAWWAEIEGQRRPWLHWAGVDPRYQGLGLGKALISKVMELFIELEGDVDVFLKTQTWSYKAVDIYMKNGFRPTAEKALYKKRKHNYKKAMKILQSINNGAATLSSAAH